jgi:hypothetical protein
VKRKSAEVSEPAAPTYTDLIQSAADRVGPLAQAAADALEAVAERVGPLAHEAADKLEPLAQSAAGKVSPLARQVGGSVGPYALLARQRSTQVAQDVIERWRPTLEEAFAKVSPSLEGARGRINDDLLPKLIAALEAAAAAPVVVEATKRGQATLAAAKGELTLPEAVQPKPKRRWIRRVLVIAAVGGVIVVVARRVLGGQDADWQAARPTAPYTPPTPPAPAANGQTQDTAETPDVVAASGAGLLSEAEAPETTSPAESARDTELGAVPEEYSAEQTPEEATALDGAAPGEPEPEPLLEADDPTVSYSGPPDEVDEGDEVEDGRAPEADRSRYTGEGVYIGNEPPEGFVIKANERSMKYHVPESMGYNRTQSEVWFNSEEAAQEAGFIRAQR